MLICLSCEIIEEDISERRVEILGPVSGASVSAGEVLFRWRSVEAAAQYEFTVVESSFAAVRRIICDTLLMADTLGSARSYGCRLRLEAGIYQWRVTAFNGGYASEPAVQTLFVEESKPQKPEQPDDNPEESMGGATVLTSCNRMLIRQNTTSHVTSDVSADDAVRRRRRNCTSFGELQSAAWGGGELPTSFNDVELSVKKIAGVLLRITLFDNSPLP